MPLESAGHPALDMVRVTPIVEADGLERLFGPVRALGPVTFGIYPDETVGILGLNGAGKTTLLRILAGDLRPTSGSVRIGGIDLLKDALKARSRIGFLPERPPLYGEMAVRPFLRFVARIKRVDPASLSCRVETAIERTGIGAVADRLVGQLSHGYRQRVGIAQAIVHEPQLLILDEPTNGLDPVQVVGMRELIAELARESTIVISSHVLTEVSRTCDRVIVIHGGRIATDRDAESIGLAGELERMLVELERGTEHQA